MNIFSDAYLSSDFCERAMDTIYSRFQLEDVGECSDFFLSEIKDKLIISNTYFPENVAEWIGFTYRQIYFETLIKSKEIIKHIPFSCMVNMYSGMHTIDENIAFDKINEMFKLTK